MDMLEESIGTWNWLFSVVIAVILINLFAKCLIPFLDTILMRLSGRYKKRAESKKRERLARIEELAQDPHGQILQSLAIIRTQVISANTRTIAAILLLMAIQLHRDRELYAAIISSLLAYLALLIEAITTLLKLRGQSQSQLGHIIMP